MNKGWFPGMMCFSLQRKCGNLSRPISRYHYHVDIESRWKTPAIVFHISLPASHQSFASKKHCCPQGNHLTKRKHMEVSWNRGTPKSSILIHFSCIFHYKLINHPFLETLTYGHASQLFANTVQTGVPTKPYQASPLPVRAALVMNSDLRAAFNHINRLLIWLLPSAHL